MGVSHHGLSTWNNTEPMATKASMSPMTIPRSSSPCWRPRHHDRCVGPWAARDGHWLLPHLEFPVEVPRGMAQHGEDNFIFFFQAEDGIRDGHVTGVQTCALPI